MRRLAIVLLAGCGCTLGGARPPVESTAPSLWVEDEPEPDPQARVDSSAWTGTWTEYYAGRPICQDRFIIRAAGATIDVESFDCTNDEPYTIADIRWDGQTLRFSATPPGSDTPIHYQVEMQGRGQIEGVANGIEITWSRTN